MISNNSKPVLRFLACGAVQAGKSTLISRLIAENNSTADDQQRMTDSAVLPVGLNVERQDGNTVEVASRHFRTDNRSFIAADPPGGEQHTREMVTGAVNADLAVIVVDAREGLLPQTFRLSIIASLSHIQHLVLAVNKLELADFSQSAFDDIRQKFEEFTAPLGFATRQAIPVSARDGDNVVSKSGRTPWYRGPSLLQHLEAVDVDRSLENKPFRMAIELVTQLDANRHGFSGTVASGSVKAGDSIVVAESGSNTKVERIVTADGDRRIASAGDAVTLCLSPDDGIARGDLLASATHRPQLADQVAAHLIWLSDESLLPGRSYLMKIGTRTVPAVVSDLKHRLAIDNMAKLAAKTLGQNEIGFCNLATASPIAFDHYNDNRETGLFVLTDRFTDATVAIGFIDFGLRRATNLHYQHITVSKQARALLKHQRPAIVWFTGLSGAGKSTIANLVESRLHARGIHTLMLDGDNVRHGLNKDLGFTEADRVENIRRVGEVAKLMVEAGLVVLCSFISPFRAERQIVRELVDGAEFIEVFVDTPLEQCIARDSKGLYRRAIAGQIQNFTGISQPYERPDDAEIHLLAAEEAPDALANTVIAELARRGIFGSKPETA